MISSKCRRQFLRRETLWQSCYSDWVFALKTYPFTWHRHKVTIFWTQSCVEKGNRYDANNIILQSRLTRTVFQILFKIVTNIESFVNSQKSLKIEPKQKISFVSLSFRFETMKIDSSRKRNQSQAAICALGLGMSRILRIIMRDEEFENCALCVDEK